MGNLENDFEQLSVLAYKGEELSDFAPLTTKYMYLRLSILYDCFARGKYTKEQCIQLKSKLKVEYRNILKEHDRDMEAYREYVKNRNENQMLLLNLEKNTEIKDMLEICLKIISNCVDDKSLYQRNMSKLDNLIFNI